MTSKSKTWEAAECRRMVPWFHDEVLFCGNKDEVKGWMYGKSAQLGRRSLSGRRGAGAGARARRRPIPASLTSNTERTEQPQVGALHDASYYARYTLAVSVTVMEGPEELRSLAEEDCDDDTSTDDDLMTISRDRQSFPSNSNTDSIHDMIALEAALTKSSEVEGSREEKGRKDSGRCFCNAVKTRYLLPIVFPAGRAHAETESHLRPMPPSSSSSQIGAGYH
ncbi:hypothetical protein EDB85DRAFT_2153167 [Lactarius pseudohatsudake]|nr:hypothetical protein EDB85DRAFT_2153167 [Lactarius pseudohatsudake]